MKAFLLTVKGARILHHAADTREKVINLKEPLLRPTVLTASVRPINKTQSLLFLSMLYKTVYMFSSGHWEIFNFSIDIEYPLPVAYQSLADFLPRQTVSRILANYDQRLQQNPVVNNGQGGTAPGRPLKNSTAP